MPLLLSDPLQGSSLPSSSSTMPLAFFAAPSSYFMSSARAREEFPQLDGPSMKYVSVFYEGMHNDARTNLAIALTAAMHGASVANYARVDKIIFDENGVARGADVTDVADVEKPKTFQVLAKKVIYCGGPFTDELREISEGPNVKKVVNGSGGTHIVLPQYYCPRHMGMVDMMTSRGSFLFFIPWEGYTLVGTTDVKTTPDLHHKVPEDEVQYLINECERYLSKSLQVRRRDVMSAWYGIRPLAVDPNASDQSSVSRDHVVSHHKTNGITFVSGGKWTTWREMAEDCVTQVVEQRPDFKEKAGPCQTLTTPLVGAGRTDFCYEGYHENLGVVMSQKFDLAWDVAQHLVKTYGTRAAEVMKFVGEGEYTESRSGLYTHYNRLYEGKANTGGYPYLEAEVRYAVANEYAVTADDILARRTRLAFLNSTAAHLVTPRVVDIMGDLLGWDAARRRREVERCEATLYKDFLGPVPNKQDALLTRACTADVKDIFDQIDTSHKGALSQQGIRDAASRLGFPLDDDALQKAMQEMDTHEKGLVKFPDFLSWWNSSATDGGLQNQLRKATESDAHERLVKNPPLVSLLSRSAVAAKTDDSK